ncbi:MAG TPA: YceI family protein [Acetobacteraceae bacterium]|nr:YceI family protein [Acetobacteraceae bacterium]
MTRVPSRALGIVLAAVLALGPAPASAGLLDYLISQHYGTIGFSVSQLGLFTVDGRFLRFAGRLAVNEQHPTETRIDVTIAAGSASMASPDAVAMLLSPAYFDAARYPEIHFVSSSITQTGSKQFVIHGILTIRGIAHPQSLEATLVREQDPPAGPVIADFKVTGSLERSLYGMTANENFVGNKVDLAIFIRLSLDPSAHGS